MSILSRIFAPREFTGWHMAGVMVLFFGTIITVNVTMAVFAGTSWTGLVVKNSYVESQRFNEVTAEKRRQQALGWSAALGYGEGELSIAMTDDAGQPLRGAIITARVGHPVDINEDRMVALKDQGGGVYVVPVALSEGRWDVDLNVTGPKGEVWTRPMRMLVKQ